MQLAGVFDERKSISMMNNPTPIRDYIVPGKRVHLVCIGGVSMCPLAEVLRGMGLTVQGSDMTDSDTVKHLRSLGISVAIGHNAENLGDCDFVVRTAAVHDDNPEIAAKLEADIRKNFDKLMTGQSRVAAKAAGRAVDVSADDFDDAD